MKKFSKSTNQKVGEEPIKKEREYSDEELFKIQVSSLMEKILSIQTYGSVDRYLRAGNIKIVGKEMFLEALLNLMNDKSLKSKVKILEGLKSKISDWEVIDRDIDETKSNIDRLSKISENKIRISNIISRYDDKDTILNQIDESLSKIKDGEKAYWRAVSAESMISDGKFSKEILKEISNKFYNKSIELGYKNIN
jgi:hypothetical protein